MITSPGRKLPWLLAGSAIVMMAAGTGFSLLYMILARSSWPLFSHQGLLQLSTLLFAGLGALILSRRAANVIGWLFLATAICTGLTALSVGYAAFQPRFGPAWLPSSAWAQWLSRWIWLPASALPTIFVFQFFPHGRLPGRRWSLVPWSAALGTIGVSLSLALHPGPIASWDIEGVNPFGIPGTAAIWAAILDYSMIPLGIGVIGAILILVRRFWRARDSERQQLKWLLYGLGLTILGGTLASAAPAFFPLSAAAVEELGLVMTSLSLMTIAAAVGIAVLRYGLYDIDLVINRTLVYGILTGIVIAVYLLAAGGLGLLLGGDSLGVSLFGALAVALLAGPARERLQRAVNRLMYGDRDDPYAALSRLGRRLENSIAADAVLPSIVATVAETLKLPYAAIALALPEESGELNVVARFGTPTPAPLVLPLVYQAEPVGSLLVGSRPGEQFAPADRRLLADLARQAGVAVHAVRLTTELQRARRRLVNTREEERRRLRRDLHDGLGSQLAALHLRLDGLRLQIPDGADAARALAIELRDEVHDAIADIRRLVYELRPPTLDELGLAGALRALAAQATAADGLKVTVDAPETQRPLPAAVEVAAYRIAQEALTNVLRHAAADRCHICLTLGADLRLEIEDDGIGLPAGARAGVGLRSMRERAVELGGVFVAEKRAGGGSRICAQLPLPAG